MAAIGRSNPQPLATHTVVSTKNKYRYVRIKEMLSHALGGARGGGLFSIGDNPPSDGGSLFQTENSSLIESLPVSNDAGGPDNNTTVDMVHQSPAPPPAGKKPSVAANSCDILVSSVDEVMSDDWRSCIGLGWVIYQGVFLERLDGFWEDGEVDMIPLGTLYWHGLLSASFFSW